MFGIKSPYSKIKKISLLPDDSVTTMYFWARFGKVSQEISAKIVVSVILSKKTKLATVNDNCELTYSSSFFAYVC